MTNKNTTVILVLALCCLFNLSSCNMDQIYMSKVQSVNIQSHFREFTRSEVVSTDSVISCMSLCPVSKCVLAVFTKSTNLCEIVLTSSGGANQQAASSYLTTPDVVVWTANDFEEKLIESTPAPKNTTLFTNTSIGRNGSVLDYTVPKTGCYKIQGWGGKGGNQINQVRPGGLGAWKECVYQLTVGTLLKILVGQEGGSNSEPKNEAGTGGGGGSFVYTSDFTLLMAAGGGGGAAQEQADPMPDIMKGQSGTSGGNGQTTSGLGGTNGNPGTTDVGSSKRGGPGAGWNGPGISPLKPATGEGGGSKNESWIGGRAPTINAGATGGFGGGGGGTRSAGASGGGGGYSGGGASSGSENHGGGGGSYCAAFAAATNGTTGGNPNNQGQVAITYTGPTC